MHPAGLYVVATPIGNLEDITYRAVRVLAEADVIAAEDTRHSRVLLDRFGIRKPIVSLHEHNEQERAPELLQRIRDGQAVALISDAGTPLISDPGFRLVGQAAAAGLPVFPIPGPSALTAALSVAGLATDRFAFEGFLPASAPGRRKRLAALGNETRTLVFFESSHRVCACLDDLADSFGSTRRAVICRELTKQFETVLRGSLDDLRGLLEADRNQQRGEFVIVVEGANEAPEAIDGLELARALLEYLPASQAARVAARLSGGTRREIYQALEHAEGAA